MLSYKKYDAKTPRDNRRIVCITPLAPIRSTIYVNETAVPTKKNYLPTYISQFVS